jgi:hypothetical protein
MNPAEPRLLRVETVADLPVLWATLQRLNVPGLLDRHFPAPRHWRGPLTPGEVLAPLLYQPAADGTRQTVAGGYGVHADGSIGFQVDGPIPWAGKLVSSEPEA